MTKPFRTLDDADVTGKRVLLRVDLNVPMENGKVTDTTRIERVAADDHRDRRQGRQGDPARPFRPAEGRPTRQFAEAGRRGGRRGDRRAGRLRRRLHRRRRREAIAKMKNGDILLLENTRFYKGEEKNDPAFVEGLAKLGDVYVNDAFSAAHRAHASTEGVAHKLPAYRGPRDAGGARGADARAWESGAAGRGDRRRRQGLEQARAARQPGQQGRRADHRRRHGQHVPVRAGQGRRQVAVREGDGRHGARDHGGRRRGQVPHRAAGRRRGRQGVQGSRAMRASSASTMSPRTR